VAGRVVPQPPLSQQIKQLEGEVEVRLFDRNKRWVRLTGAGRQLLEHARQVLAQADGAVLAARRTMGGVVGVGFRGYCARAAVCGLVDDTFRMSVRRTE